MSGELFDLIVIFHFTPLKINAHKHMRVLEWWLRNDKNVEYMLKTYSDQLEKTNKKNG